MDDSPCKLVWLQGSSRQRLLLTGARRSFLPASVYYTPFVCSQLAAIGCLGPDVSALDAERHFNDGHSGKIFGLALVRRRCVADLTTALSASSNALRDVYLPSKYAGAPLVLLDVIKTVALVEPAEGDTGDRAVWGGRGIFWELNRPCFDRLVERLVRAPAETLVRGVVASWIETLGIEPRQLLDEFGRFRTVFVLPRPHVELICAGKWTQTCFPFVQGRAAAGCGLPYAAPLRNGLAQLVQQQLSREQDALRLVSSSDEFTPEKIQEILDTMRDHIGGEAEPALLGAISWLQRRRDEAALDSLLQSQSVFDRTHRGNGHGRVSSS